MSGQCPAWCTRKGKHGRHEQARYLADVSVALSQSYDHAPEIYVSALAVGLGQAAGVVSLMRQLGHEEIAAAVGELAEAAAAVRGGR